MTEKNDKIVIYTKEMCPYCTMAKGVFDDMGLEYVEKDASDDAVLAELKGLVPDVKTVPQIFIYGKHIGGYEELVKYIEETGFSGSGNSLS